MAEFDNALVKLPAGKAGEYSPLDISIKKNKESESYSVVFASQDSVMRHISGNAAI